LTLHERRAGSIRRRNDSGRSAVGEKASPPRTLPDISIRICLRKRNNFECRFCSSGILRFCRSVATSNRRSQPRGGPSPPPCPSVVVGHHDRHDPARERRISWIGRTSLQGLVVVVDFPEEPHPGDGDFTEVMFAIARLAGQAAAVRDAS
jgi:hypothetical protein